MTSIAPPVSAYVLAGQCHVTWYGQTFHVVNPFFSYTVHASAGPCASPVCGVGQQVRRLWSGVLKIQAVIIALACRNE